MLNLDQVFLLELVRRLLKEQSCTNKTAPYAMVKMAETPLRSQGQFGGRDRTSRNFKLQKACLTTCKC
jgi:hypothetical protein